MAKILVVDDEVGIRELLSDILSDEGYTVYAAENAASARVFMSHEEFDLVMLDIWMPDTDGITLLKEWGSKKMLKCPVIMMSGHGSIETAIEATKFGALDYLEKPIPMQRLLQCVRHALEVRQRIATMAKLNLNARPETRPLPEPLPAPESMELPKFAVENTGIVIDFEKSLREVRESVEKAYLLCLMQREGCQMTRVAKHAGLERTHLYRKLKSLNMEIPRATSTLRSNDVPRDKAALFDDDPGDIDQL